MKNKKKSKKGFSLIEVLVALLVLSVGIGATISLMMQNIRSYQNSRDQIIASMLAQEGIELIRNLKDNGQLDTASAFCDYTSGPRTCNNLRIDASGLFDNNASKRLFLNANYYLHTGAAADSTRFYRTMYLDIQGNHSAVPSTRVIKITSYVTWNDSGFAAIPSPPVFPANCNIANQCVSVVSIIPDTE